MRQFSRPSNLFILTLSAFGLIASSSVQADNAVESADAAETAQTVESGQDSEAPRSEGVQAAYTPPPAPAFASFNSPLGDCLVEKDVTCNQYLVDIVCNDGVEDYEIYLVFTFEDPLVPLDVASLTITPELIDPLDTQWDTRLPPGFFPIRDLPVLVNVEPGTGPSGIVFQGDFTVDLETDNLEFDGEATFRLMQAPTDGNFEDVTRNFGLGSYRVRGTSGQFSDYMMAADLRPFDVVMGIKYQRFRDTLIVLSQGIDGAVREELNSNNNASEVAFDAGDLETAILKIDSNVESIEINTENGLIDDDFTGPGGQSVAGVLFGQALSQLLSLEIASLPRSPESIGREDFLTTDNGKELLVRVGFNGQQSFNLDELQITATDVDPLDPSITDRLPANVSVPGDFPVLVEINPGPDAQQAFFGQLLVDFETEDLIFRADSNLRLFKAEDEKSPFEEISTTLGFGSYRVRGTSGQFSQFMILEDDRTPDEAASFKLSKIEAILDTYSDVIDATVLNDLFTRVETIVSKYQAGSYRDAIVGLRMFIDKVEDEAGEGIPGVWNPSEQLINVAAALRSSAETAEFSVKLVENPPANDPADSNRDGVVDVQDVFFVIDRVFSNTESGEGLDDAEREALLRRLLAESSED